MTKGISTPSGRPRHASGRMASLALGALATVAVAVPVAVAPVPAEAATGCRVDYTVPSQWPGGFGANVTITNLGSAVTAWTLTWTFTGGQTITQSWNGSVTQSGAAVSVTNAGWNGAIATNGTASFGFNGTFTSTNPAPSSFALNGTTCTGAATTPTPTTSATTTPATTTTSPTTTSPTTTSRATTTTTGTSATTTTSRATTTTGTSATTTTTRATTTTTSTPSGPAVAFPGAIGFGAVATGGRGGSVYHVTNLNDSGAGSFRDAVSANNRIVVFDVGGYIRLTSTVLVKSNLTIAGQTAPGGGTGVMGGEVSFNSATNVIVRNFRFRQGDLDSHTTDNGVNLLDASNVIFDHVSIEFGQWNNIDAVRAKNITIQNSINANPIGQQFAAHTETGPYTWYQNLFANSHNRCPLAKANTQYVNNVVYNYQAAYTAGNSSGHFLHDVIGNYFITGPRTTNASNAYYQMGNQSVFNSGNVIDSNRDGVLNGSTLGVGGGGTALTSPWSSTTTSIPAAAAATAYATVLANSGALPRDQIDALVVADVRSLGTAGNLWASQTTTGLGNSGYGTLAAGSAPADTDQDGMPDTWETRYGLNPASASDGTGDFDRTGYTNTEKYVNSILDKRYP